MRLLLALLAIGACQRPHPSTEPIAPYDPLALVDPMIGTGGRGGEVVGLNPGAAVPFGFVQVGPDTRHSSLGQPGFYHFGGYHHDDDRIDGFGHTHANGMGVNDLGGVVVMPRAQWRDSHPDPRERAAPFDHATEQASPGWYAVTLDDDGTRVEIAATARGAVHRYTFAADAEPIVLFDLGYSLGDVEIPSASVAVDGATLSATQLVAGSYSRRFGGIPHHVHATFEPAPSASGVWTASTAPAAGTAASGEGVGAWVAFPPGTTEVTLRIALSTTGPAGAAANHAAEVAGASIEGVRAEAEAAWREALSAVQVAGGTDEQRVIFHTALYHALLWPNLYQDVDGTYLGFDGELHAAEHPYHSAFSLWDTFRTAHPLYTLAIPERHEAMLASLLLMAEQGGSMPRWPLGHGYTGGMIGSPAAIVLAEAHLKGLDLGDPQRAFDLAVPSALGPVPDAGRADIVGYRERGWVALDEASGAASRTLEYAWADHALASWAEDLGRDERAAELRAQSGSWRNTWDAEDGFFLGRNADGSFPRAYNDESWSRDFVEGTAWQYLFGVPFDVDGMIELQDGGDRDAFLGRLDAFWVQARAEEDDLLFDSYYWHGNEPDLHYAFLGSLAGDRDRSAEAVRWVLDTRYGTGPDGLDGNDDAGTLSAWYVLAASGIYPIAGTTTYAVGSPIFERVEIGGRVIRAEGIESGPYVLELRVGDELIEGGTFEHAQLDGADELVFVLGSR